MKTLVAKILGVGLLLAGVSGASAQDHLIHEKLHGGFAQLPSHDYNPAGSGICAGSRACITMESTAGTNPDLHLKLTDQADSYSPTSAGLPDPLRSPPFSGDQHVFWNQPSNAFVKNFTNGSLNSTATLVRENHDGLSPLASGRPGEVITITDDVIGGDYTVAAHNYGEAQFHITDPFLSAENEFYQHNESDGQADLLTSYQISVTTDGTVALATDTSNMASIIASGNRYQVGTGSLTSEGQSSPEHVFILYSRAAPHANGVHLNIMNSDQFMPVEYILQSSNSDPNAWDKVGRFNQEALLIEAELMAGMTPRERLYYNFSKQGNLGATKAFIFTFADVTTQSVDAVHNFIGDTGESIAGGIESFQQSMDDTGVDLAIRAMNADGLEAFSYNTQLVFHAIGQSSLNLFALDAAKGVSNCVDLHCSLEDTIETVSLVPVGKVLKVVPTGSVGKFADDAIGKIKQAGAALAARSLQACGRSKTCRDAYIATHIFTTRTPSIDFNPSTALHQTSQQNTLVLADDALNEFNFANQTILSKVDEGADVSGKFISTNRITPELLNDAQRQLDELSSSLRGQRNPPATAIGAIDPQLGRVVTATSGDIPTNIHPKLQQVADDLGGIGIPTSCGNVLGRCAEFRAANELLLGNPHLNLSDIGFTPAVRPRTGQVISRCENCINVFGTE